MVKQETSILKKRRGPVPREPAVPVMVRCHRPMLTKIDAWRRGQTDLPSRPEAIRRLIEQALSGKAKRR
jgi:hypothetical protein